jgi:hypothetical protein
MKSLRHHRAFTLVEMILALAVAMLLLVVLLSITMNASSWMTTIQGRASAIHDAQVALDYLERDFVSLIPTDLAQSTLAIVPETVSGPNASAISSFWIMMLCRPVDTSIQGATKVVSYRLIYSDPMTPNGVRKQLVLYRTIVTGTTASTAFNQADLYSGYWKNYWPTYASLNSGKAILDDYLLKNVVDIKVSACCSNNGSLATLSLNSTLNWTASGFSASNITTPNIPLSISVTLTVLTSQGVRLQESGALSLADIIAKEGVVVNRTFPIMANQVF